MVEDHNDGYSDGIHDIWGKRKLYFGPQNLGAAQPLREEQVQEQGERLLSPIWTME